MALKIFNSAAANTLTSLVKLLITSKFKLELILSKSRASKHKTEKANIVKWKHIYGVNDIPWSLEYDFLKYRGPSYLRNTKQCFSSYYEILFGLGTLENVPEIPTNERFYNCLMTTGNTFYLKETEQEHVYLLDMKQLMNVVLFPGYYFEVRGLEVDMRTKEITIITRHNKRIGPASPNYNQAKIHAMSCLSYFTVGIGHSWVHFQFPCVTSAVVFNDIPRDSVLYKILYIHTRFTMRINHQALRVGHSTNNKNTKLKKFNAIQPLPMTVNTFIENNQARTVDFYKLDGEFSAPPVLDTKFPYHKFVGAYYDVIRKFIEDLGDALEMDLLEKLIAEVDKYIPARLSDYKPKDVLATFIWQVSVLHSSDHHTFYSQFKNASPMIKHRLEEGEPDQPEEMFEKIHLAKYENFLNLFVKFSYDEEFPNNLANLTYNFKDPQLQDIENEFVKHLKTIESEFAEDNLGLVPLSQMAQSVCF